MPRLAQHRAHNDIHTQIFSLTHVTAADTVFNGVNCTAFCDVGFEGVTTTSATYYCAANASWTLASDELECTRACDVVAANA